MQVSDPRRRTDSSSVVSVLKSRESNRQAQPLVRRLNEDSEAARAARAAADGGIHAKAAAWRAAQDGQPVNAPEDTPAVSGNRGVIDDALAAPDAYTAAAGEMPEDSRPEVVRHQERLAQMAESLRREPAPEPGNEPVTEPEVREQAPARRGLSIFGRRAKTPPAQAETRTAPRPPAETQRPRQPAEPVQRNAPGGDLFSEEFDDTDLDIPAFLRRQAN